VAYSLNVVELADANRSIDRATHRSKPRRGFAKDNAHLRDFDNVCYPNVRCPLAARRTLEVQPKRSPVRTRIADRTGHIAGAERAPDGEGGEVFLIEDMEPPWAAMLHHGEPGSPHYSRDRVRIMLWIAFISM
jgi:hypothetical protein